MPKYMQYSSIEYLDPTCRVRVFAGVWMGTRLQTKLKARWVVTLLRKLEILGRWLQAWGLSRLRGAQVLSSVAKILHSFQVKCCFCDCCSSLIGSPGFAMLGVIVWSLLPQVTPPRSCRIVRKHLCSGYMQMLPQKKAFMDRTWIVPAATLLLVGKELKQRFMEVTTPLLSLSESN